MKLPLPTDFFAPVRLAPREVRELQQVEARLLDSYLTSYDAYAQLPSSGARSADDAASSRTTWKLVGQRDGVKIFSKRQQKRKGSKHDRQQPEQEPQPRQRRRHVTNHEEHSHLPGVRVVGSVDGTLEDILYGSMWRSGRERVARASFTRDGVADGAVLCSVESPSAGDPFRSLSVKWTLKRAPHGGLVVKDRDFCYLAATGVVRSPRTGHKLGYRLRHSMTFPSCPPFQNRSVVRGQLFFCSFFRQLRNGRVEVFHQGSYDAGGGGTGFGLGLPRSIAEKSVIENLVGLGEVRVCALAKKLARVVEGSDLERIQASLSRTSVQESLDGERRCGMCLRRLGSALRRRCAACRHWTCAQCSVRQQTVPSSRAVSTGAAVVKRCFCKACVARVLRDDATPYAIRDANTQAQETSSGRWGHDEIPEEDEEEDEALALANRRHSIVLFAPDASSYEVEALVGSSRQRRVMTAAAAIPTVSAGFEPSTPSSRLSAKQMSVDSDAVNTVNSSPPDNRRHRSAALATARTSATRARAIDCSRPHRRLSLGAPDILLRSDVTKRNWASSASALCLQSPQRSVDGSPIVNVQRTSRWPPSPSMRRISFGSSCSSSGKSDEVHVRICTPRRRQTVAAYTPYAATPSNETSPEDRGPSPSRSFVQRRFFRELYSQ
ncbi:hypothetical protein BBJ28_00014420 [Nothophytophthora sp. Chile5]|nr:hypothetical protein BBJ28_00014420 [Nothophytophthora sp. Chile5]